MHRFFSFLLLAAVVQSTAGAIENPLYNVGNRVHPQTQGDSYLTQVQPILSARCVSCHGCYEAPCQLNLESYEGLRRGYHPTGIFAGTRLAETKPTRLIDASSIADWRKNGFLSVVPSSGAEAEGQDERAEDSVMYQLLKAGSQNNAPGFAINSLSEINQKFRDSAPQCVSSAKQWNDTFRFSAQNPWSVKYAGHFLEANPNAGMPFGLPKLDAGKEKVLFDWIADGAKGPDRAAAEKLQAPERPEVIARWEAFLNGNSAKEQQSARYIYEHVYTAHLYFEENPGEFFELVRSRTLSGPIDQIVTALPYDAPGVARAHYRLKKITRSIAQKTHFVWRLNDARLAHLRDLFLNAPEWAQSSVPLPEYGSPNPFRYFASIPARVRSQFMMENSRVIVGGMTQGSVCIGSTATYAISDHFWAWFLKPEFDPSVQTPTLGLPDIDMLATAPLAWQPTTAAHRLAISRLDRLSGPDLQIAKAFMREYRRIFRIKLDPITEATNEEMVVRLREHGLKGIDIMSALYHYFRTTKGNTAYQEAYERNLRRLLKSKGRNALSVHDLWVGEGDSSYPKGNPNAWLNITRHGRSATVQHGEAGGEPQSIWILSYSNFERLYYDLVASYKEWGSVLHKMATWRHMSYVRLEGEDLAISMLPLEHRKEVRARFTRGIGMVKQVAGFPMWSGVGMTEGRHYNPLYYTPLYNWDLPPRPSPYRYGNADQSIRYVVGAVRTRMGAMSGAPREDEISADRLAFEQRLEKLENRSKVRTGEGFAHFMPSITYVKVEGTDEQPWVYTILADRGYKAHNIMMAENINREPEADTLSIYRGLVGHYPGAFMVIPAGRADAFLAEITRLSSEPEGKAFWIRWGISRSSAAFWPFFDWLHEFKNHPSPGVDPVEQGVVDLTQYHLF